MEWVFRVHSAAVAKDPQVKQTHETGLNISYGFQEC